MDEIGILPLVSRWLHVIAASILVGGTVFLRLALLPAFASATSDVAIREATRVRWARIVMWSVLFLLISGLYNSAIKAMGFHLDGLYLTLLSAKIVLALGIFFLVSVLAGRSALAQRFRQAEMGWYNLTCILMLFVVCIAGWMKLSPQEVKERDRNQAAAVSATDESK